jgi:hypothetical protein
MENLIQIVQHILSYNFDLGSGNDLSLLVIIVAAGSTHTILQAIRQLKK